MGLEFNITITKEKILKKWSEQVDVSEWIGMYENLSDSYSSWTIDLELAEFIVKRVKEDYINKYLEEDIPEVLKPLLLNAISNDIISKNNENLKITLEEVSSIAELKAIEKLREYSYIDYEDAVNIFCDGYDLASIKKETNVDLSSIDSKYLIKEIQNRL